MHRNKYQLIVPFLVPSAMIYSIFVIYPYISAMYTSLTIWHGYSPTKKFVGLYNFEQLLQDNHFWGALEHNLVFLIALPLITLSIALFFAFLFTQVRRSDRFYTLSQVYRVTYFFPQVMSAVAIAVLWSFVFHPTIGILNSVLHIFGISGPTWLGDPHTSLISVLIVSVWSAVGFYMILFIAGMQSIPGDYYEAARIDGADGWNIFWQVTWPLLWDHTRAALIFICISAMDMFTLTQVLTEGGPNNSSDVLATLLYRTAFQDSQFGYATAIGVALFVITMVISGILFQIGRRERLEY
ncbi:MAG TPA: sugar ABC transporter permease [Chloroflexota bacterium]|nr:sugar ABC transporter permease [Chloroflexota bacterium]